MKRARLHQPPPAHTCAAVGCQHQVPMHLLMCSDHWRMVPTKLRRAVWDAWRARGLTREGHDNYAKAVRLAVEAVHAKGVNRKATKDQTTPPLF